MRTWINSGLDILASGADCWPVKVVNNNVPTDMALGMFHDEFGDKTIKKIKKYINKGFKIFRIQLHYDSSHSLIDVTRLRELATLYQTLARNNPSCVFYLSHSTEYYSRNAQDIKARVDCLRNNAPTCIAVNNPHLKGLAPSYAPGITVLTEIHYPDKRLDVANIISFDGQDSSDVDAKAYMTKFYESSFSPPHICFSWGVLFNLQDGKQAADPKKRKATPTAKYIKEYVKLSECVPPCPAFSLPGIKLIRIKKPYLYKPMSRGTNDDREWKPVLITPSKAKSLSIVTYDGTKIGTLGFFGAYENLFRHYSSRGSNLWGFNIYNKAVKASLSPWVAFVDEKEKKAYGPVYPVCREGFFRNI